MKGRKSQGENSGGAQERGGLKRILRFSYTAGLSTSLAGAKEVAGERMRGVGDRKQREGTQILKNERKTRLRGSSFAEEGRAHPHDLISEWGGRVAG